MKGNRFVLDTNVLISAALSTRADPARVTLWVIANGRIVFSDPTFDEFRECIWRPKFDKYLTIEQRNRIVHDFGAIGKWVDIAGTVAPVACRDPDDEIFVRTAIAGDAPWLVTGDGDLLALPDLDDVTILSPAAMLARIGEQVGANV